MTASLPENGLALRHQLALAFLAFLLVVSHRPDMVLNAQFFAEDGPAWFKDAYDAGGLRVLFLAQAGYLHLIQRLGSAIAVPLPLRFAPLLFNLIAISCQVLVVNLLASRRLEFLIPDLKARLLIALVYVGRPDSWETMGLFTTSHWHLAVAASIVMLGEPARHRLWRVADCGVIVLGALSSPYAILLPLVAAPAWWIRRGRWPAIYLSVATGCAMLQGITALLTAATERGSAPLEASPGLFAEIVGMQVVLVGLIGERFFSHLPVAIDKPALTLMSFFAGVPVFLYALWRSPWPLRLFVGVSLAVLAVALAMPLISGYSAQWPDMISPGIGGRYWLLPRLAFLASLGWMAYNARQRLVRRAATTALLLLLPIGIAIDWSHRPFADLDWTERAEAFEAASPETTMEFPVHPGWTLTLTKK